MTRLQTIYVLSALIGLGAVAIAYFLPVYPYTPDSACYIEQARSLLAGAYLKARSTARTDPRTPLSPIRFSHPATRS